MKFKYQAGGYVDPLGNMDLQLKKTSKKNSNINKIEKLKT